MMIWRAEKDDHVGQAKLTATLEDGTFHRTLESFFYEDSIDVSAADASPSLSSLLPHVQAAFNAIFELEDREPVCLTSKDDAKTRPLHDSCNVLVRLTYAFYFLSRHRSDYKYDEDIVVPNVHTEVQVHLRTGTGQMRHRTPQRCL